LTYLSLDLFYLFSVFAPNVLSKNGICFCKPKKKVFALVTVAKDLYWKQEVYISQNGVRIATRSMNVGSCVSRKQLSIKDESAERGNTMENAGAYKAAWDWDQSRGY